MQIITFLYLNTTKVCKMLLIVVKAPHKETRLTNILHQKKICMSQTRLRLQLPQNPTTNKENSLLWTSPLTCLHSKHSQKNIQTTMISVTAWDWRTFRHVRVTLVDFPWPTWAAERTFGKDPRGWLRSMCARSQARERRVWWATCSTGTSAVCTN